MEEDVVVRNGKAYGKVPRSVVHRNGTLHFCVHLLAVAGTRVFLQRRASARARNANKWTSTVSGHINAQDAAQGHELSLNDHVAMKALEHETREELALDLDVHRAKYVGQVPALSKSHSETCNCLAYVFVLEVMDLPPVNTPEVREIRAFELSHISEALDSGLGLPSANGVFGFADNFEPVFRCFANALTITPLRAIARY
jgi:isopentenyldiphosphate isomerase